MVTAPKPTSGQLPEPAPEWVAVQQDGSHCEPQAPITAGLPVTWHNPAKPFDVESARFRSTVHFNAAVRWFHHEREASVWHRLLPN